MKPLLFLFLLDYSGSMYQPVQNVPKYQTVRENISALKAEALRQNHDAESGYVIFGLHPKKKCQDLEYGEGLTEDISKRIDKFRPGAFAKTPLADAIEYATQKSIERRPKKVIVFSDGADTCGKDPCVQLVKSNEELASANVTMYMTFIGIDLKEDEKKFECFKTLKLSNLKIDYMNASNSFDAQKALKEDEAEEPVQDPFGKIVVQGAPAGVHFQIYKKTKKMSEGEWQGSYGFKVREGDYSIQASEKGTRRVEAEVIGGQRLIFHWEDFFASPFTKFEIPDSRVSLVFTPTNETNAIHRHAYPFTVHGQNDRGAKFNNSLPFGSWKVEITSPAWLKQRATKVNMVFPPGKKVVLDPAKIFSLQWESPPVKGTNWVLMFDKEEKYFVPSNMTQVPVTKDSNHQWIRSESDL